MKKEKIIAILTPFWKEHLEKKGLILVREQVKVFHTEMKRIQKVNLVTILSFLTHPYHLSYYVSLLTTRRRVLRSFWRFSTALCKIRKAYDQKILSTDEWNDYLTQYFQGTLESENRESNLFILSEVLPLVDH